MDKTIANTIHLALLEQSKNKEDGYDILALTGESFIYATERKIPSGTLVYNS